MVFRVLVTFEPLATSVGAELYQERFSIYTATHELLASVTEHLTYYHTSQHTLVSLVCSVYCLETQTGETINAEVKVILC